MRGFTLIEVLVVMSIVAIVGTAGASVFRSFNQTNNLSVVVNTVATSLDKARTLSVGAVGDETWGVSIAQGELVIFQGPSYVSRSISQDEVLRISSQVSPSGLTEVVFDKLSGQPQSTGTIILSTEHDTRNIIINQQGSILY